MAKLPAQKNVAKISITYDPVASSFSHFTNIRNSDDLEKKLLNFLHHIDFEHSGLKSNDLKKLIEEKKVMYNHKIDSKRAEHDKWGEGGKL